MIVSAWIVFLKSENRKNEKNGVKFQIGLVEFIDKLPFINGYFLCFIDFLRNPASFEKQAHLTT